MRFGLLSYVHHGKDINLDLNVLISHRQFCNKIWNSFKFAMQNIGDGFIYDISTIDKAQFNHIDKWILSKLNLTIQAINKNFEGYFFAEATDAFLNYWVQNLCDVYLEYSKIALKDESRAHITKTILFHCIETGLRLLHPMMTYITEELYQKLPDWQGKASSITIAEYPVYNAEHFFENYEEFTSVMDIITDLRKLLGTVNLPPKSNPPVYLVIGEENTGANLMMNTFADFISSLAKVGDVKVHKDSSSVPKGCLTVLSAKVVSVNLEISKFIKIEDEIKKINKKVAEKEKAKDALDKKMKNVDYESKVPENVRIQDKEKLDLYIAEIETLKANVQSFETMI